MSDGSDPSGFDPCECIWNQELAMRRLINLLRSSQSYCNDNECLDLPGFQGQTQNESNMLFLIVCWAVLALGLFLMRPRSLRTQDDSKPSDRQGPGSNPPNPPPAVN